MIDSDGFPLLAAVSWSLPEQWPLQFAQIRDALAQLRSPDEFLKLVQRHRVPALAERALSRYADESGQHLPWLKALRLPAQRCRLSNLRYHAELLRLQVLFNNAGLPVFALKGTELGLQLYGDIGLRHQRDIDLLVAPGDLPRALDLLDQADYDSGLPSRSRRPHHLRLVQTVAWEIECHHRQSGVQVEIHWHFERVSNSAREAVWWQMLRSEQEHPYAQILHLCMHGTTHGWSRLKWLGDLRAKFARLNSDQWQRLIAASAKLELHSVLAETLLLNSRIFRVPLTASQEGLVDHHRRIAERNLHIAIRRLRLDSDGLARPSLRFAFESRWLEIHPARRHTALEQASYWVRCLTFSFNDLRMIHLPLALAWLYPLIRPFGVFLRRRERHAQMAEASRRAH